MRTSRLVVVILLLFLSSMATAQIARHPSSGITNPNARFGLGFTFGSPTGVAWKYWLSSRTALDGAIGFSPYDQFRMHIDYLVHTYPFESEYLSLYYGGGGAIGTGRTDVVRYWRNGWWITRDERLGFGVRGVLGLAVPIPSTPLDSFIEMAPILVFAPDPVGFVFDFALGARVYF
jgi:hypothetical protein